MEKMWINTDQIYTVKQNEFRLWLLIGETDISRSPKIPEKLVHQHNAFLLSPIHDYEIRNKKLKYFGSYTGRTGIWAVIDYREG